MILLKLKFEKAIRMQNKYYNANRQKLLFMVEKLHQRGFEKLEVIPYLSPSGIYWRCEFMDQSKKTNFMASDWISKHENGNPNNEIKLSLLELADLFIAENLIFMQQCKGINEKYTKWYSEMLKQLKKEELPYAFADWEIIKGIWETSKNKQIKTLDYIE